MAILYKGFSTYNRTKKFRLTDHELIKQDLFNNFNVKKGEKLMQPNFGTIIWNMMFEPLTEETRSLMVDDVKRIVAYDPRTRATNVIVTQFEYGIQIEIELLFIDTNQVDVLAFNFDNQSQTLTRA
jgi:phage baseplate assembly protein W